jgi:hypothetical protein
VRELHKKLIIFITLALAISLIYGLGLNTTHRELQVWDVNSDKLLAAYDVETGDKLGFKFIHSYDKGPVWDYFIIQKDGSLLLHEVAFGVQSYDGRELTYPDIPRILKDGVVYLKDIDKVYSEIYSQYNVRVPYTVPQWILFGNKAVELSSLAPSGTLLKIKVDERG